VTILADWADRGLKIVIVTQQLEFNGAIGRTLAALLLGLAESELDKSILREAVLGNSRTHRTNFRLQPGATR